MSALQHIDGVELHIAKLSNQFERVLLAGRRVKEALTVEYELASLCLGKFHSPDFCRAESISPRMRGCFSGRQSFIQSAVGVMVYSRLVALNKLPIG